MYRKIDSDMNFKDRELEILEFWKSIDLQHKLEEANEGQENFTIYDGPPTANGKPHIGHVLTRSIKDLFPRYRRMKGQHVVFKAGWDTHGLPVELEVEKSLGIDGKEQIESYGVEAFIQKCRESVWKYKGEWEDLSDRLAFSADMEHPYVTYENSYIESVWWSLKQVWDKGLLYNGFKVVPYCPRCGTALSSHEVAQGYKDVVDTSVYVRFKVKDEDAYFAVWTTTPWTLPSNVALCVNPNDEYALIELNNQAKEGVSSELAEVFQEDLKYYVATQLADTVFGEGNYNVLKTCKGQDLVGLHYEPLLPFANEAIEKSKKDALYVLSDNYVTMDDGTGIVHMAPAFGEDDARVGQANNLPFVQLVDTEGKMTSETREFAGLFVKEADQGIMELLEKENKLLIRQPYEHSYPHCWRCDTPLIYYARNTWFIAMTKLRDRLLANNDRINWIPETVKTGRFGNFIANVVDWGLSRERYWGTPLPIWQCPDCGHEHCIGSVEELRSMSDNCPEDLDLHKPYIDRVHIACPECGSQMHRVKEVIDGWYDSGSMPFAQYHYPFENKEFFEEHFPANFISEAQDQTRGWFYSLLAISTLLFDQASFENVIVMGLVQDKDGKKMSKHLGNVVDPWDILNKQGADAVRWYFYHNSQPWLPARFSHEAVLEGQRKFMATLWNTLAFYVLYADIDAFDPTEYSLDYEALNVMDRWLLAELYKLIHTVDNYLEHFDATGAARSIQDFTETLSNWYVRRSRERFWASGMEQDKINAFMTLYTAMETLARLSAPFVPFISEYVYQTLVKTTNEEAPLSVHLTSFPEAPAEWRDEDLLEEMDYLIDLVQLGRAARNNSNVKNRQPLAKAIVVSPQPLSDELSQVLKDELNIDEIEYSLSDDGLMSHRFKPQLKTLGKKLGPKIPKVKTLLETIDGDKAWAELEQTGSLTLVVDGESVVLDKGDLLISQVSREGYETMQDEEATIALDLTLTPELINRGLVREVISKVQNMRKQAGFEVTDRIILFVEGSEDLNKAISDASDLIKDEVLADDLVFEKNDSSQVWDINGHETYLAVERQ